MRRLPGCARVIGRHARTQSDVTFENCLTDEYKLAEAISMDPFVFVSYTNKTRRRRKRGLTISSSGVDIPFEKPMNLGIWCSCRDQRDLFR